MNKRAIELSVNFLVVMIVSIVVFAMGIWLVYKIYNQGIDMQQNMDEKTKLWISELLDSGERVAIPITDDNEAENKRFSKFGIGILNVLGRKTDFNITVYFNKAFDYDQNQIDTSKINPNEWIDSAIYEKKEPDGLLIKKSIKNNEKFLFTVGFIPKDALAGTYIFDVNVTCDHPQCAPNRMYDNRVYKLRLHVK